MKHKILRTVKTGLLICASFLCTPLMAQDSHPSSLAIGVLMPDSIKGMPADMLPLLESKIGTIITSQGLSSYGGTGRSFVIYPIVSVFGKRQTAGGMQNITVVSANLSLVVKHIATNTVFSSLSKNIQGSGLSGDEAARDLFNQVNPSDPEYINFVEKAKAKILDYYARNCDQLIKTSESERMQKNYEAALNTLLSVPAEVTACYDKAQAKAKSTFTEMLKYNCGRYVQEAKAFAAGNDYENALHRLSWIDPTVSCGNDVRSLLNSMGKEMDEDKRKAWDLLFKIYDGKIEMAKARAYALNNYTVYLQSARPGVVTYGSIVK